jgi:hypothetical protein
VPKSRCPPKDGRRPRTLLSSLTKNRPLGLGTRTARGRLSSPSLGPFTWASRPKRTSPTSLHRLPARLQRWQVEAGCNSCPLSLARRELRRGTKALAVVQNVSPQLVGRTHCAVVLRCERGAQARYVAPPPPCPTAIFCILGNRTCQRRRPPQGKAHARAASGASVASNPCYKPVIGIRISVRVASRVMARKHFFHGMHALMHSRVRVIIVTGNAFVSRGRLACGAVSDGRTSRVSRSPEVWK